MERAKLKQIVLIILILLNLCLLLLVGGRVHQERAAQEELRRNTVSFLKQNGISVQEDQIPWEKRAVVQITERSTDEEKKLAEAMLGSARNNAFGIASEYTGDRGTARFYPDGRFLISLETARGDPAHDPAHQAQRILEKLGFEVLRLSETTEGDQTKLVFMQLTDATPVFTCEIEVSYQKGILQQIQGFRLQGEVQKDSSNQQVLSTATLMVGLITELRENALSCSEIKSITQGYVYSTGALSSQSTLWPVWRVETDQNTILLNCVTGKLETPHR